MARQTAVLLSAWKGSGTEKDPFRPALSDQLQSGESAADRTGTPVKDLVPAKNAVAVEVEAEEARILDAAGLRVLWRKYVDNTSASARDADGIMDDAEITALRNFLNNQYGFTAGEIAAWFNVTTAELATWLKNHTRREVAVKIVGAWSALTKASRSV